MEHLRQRPCKNLHLRCLYDRNTSDLLCVAHDTRDFLLSNIVPSLALDNNHPGVLIQIRLWFLIDPIELALLVLDHFTLREPQRDFLLGVLDTVRAVANVAANILM